MSGPPVERPGARQRRHLAFVHPEGAGVALIRTPAGDLALPAVEVAWDFASAVPAPGPGGDGVGPRHAVLACLAEVEDPAAVAPGRVERPHGRSHGTGGPLPWFVQVAAPSGAFGDDAKERCAAAMGDVVRTVRGELREGLAHGLDDRTPAAVAAGLAEVWASPELATLGAAERASLPELDARWRVRLAALEGAAVPWVLVHGDLHAGNVLAGVDGPNGDAVIDWTDAAVGWPGLDLLTVLGLDGAIDDDVADRVVTAYAEAAGPALGRLGVDAVRLGLAAAPAFHAVSYARIEATTPPSQRWHLEGAVRSLVRRRLRDEGLN